MAVELGVGYLSILPSMRDFKRKLDSAVGHLTATVTVVPDTSKATAALRNLKVPSLEASVNPNVGGFTARLRGLIGDQSSVGRQMGDTAGSGLHDALTSAARRTVATIAGIFAAQKLFNVGEQAFKEAANFETTQVAFTGLLGSAKLANEELAKLQQFAAVTPFEFPDLTDAARKLLAFGFDVDEIIPTMQKLGDAAAAIGVGGPAINLVVRALGQILSKGKVQQEELIQIAENFPGVSVVDDLAASVGKTTAEFQAAANQPGGVTLAFGLTSEEAVATILDSFTKINGASGAMERQSKTLNGALSTLKDTLRITAIESLKPFLPGIADFILKKVVPAVTTAGLAFAAFFNTLRGVKLNPDLLGKGFIGKVEQFGLAVRKKLRFLSDQFTNFQAGLDGSQTSKIMVRLGRLFGTADSSSLGGFLNDQLANFRAGLEGSQTSKLLVVIGRIFGRLRDAFGPVLKDLVDGVKEFVKAFETGTADVTKSGFLGFMSDLGDAARVAYEWLKEKIPLAFDAFIESVDKARTKLNELFTFISDHKDAFLVITGGVLGFVGAIRTISSLGSIAGAISGVLSLGPLGLVVGAIGGLGVAAFLAYEKFQPFRDAVDAVILKFKEGGLTAALDEAGKRVGLFADSFDGMWVKVKPKLERFWIDVQTWFKDHVADLLDFEVASPVLDVPPGAEGVNPSPNATDFFGLESAPPVPPKQQFKTFGEGFADRMMNQVVPAIGQWFLDNKQKVYDALGKLLSTINSWVDEVAIPTLIQKGKEFGPALLKGLAGFAGENALQELKMGLKLNFFLSGSAADALASITDFLAGPGLDALESAAKTVGAAVAVALWAAILAPEALFDWIDEKLRTSFSQMDTWIKDNGPALLSGAAEIVWKALLAPEAFFDWLDEKLRASYTAWDKWIRDNVPGLLSGAAEIVWKALLVPEKLFDWIDEKLRESYNAWNQWIKDNGPGLLSGAAEAVWKALLAPEAFFDWLDEKLRESYNAWNQWVIDNGPSLLRGAARALWDAILAPEGLFDWIDENLTKAFDQIDSWISTAAQGLWDVLPNGLRSAIREMAIAWNSLSLEFSVPDIWGVPHRGERFDLIPNVPVPEFASGAFVTHPTLALVGEAGPEIVAPQRMLAETFRRELSAVGAGGQGVSFGGVTINEANDPSKTLAVLDGWARWKLTGRGER